MTDSKPVQRFDTPDVDGVASVSIHTIDAELPPSPFRAIQYYHRETLDDGTKWHVERDDYVLTEEYRRAVAASTHIPIKDIRLESLPVAEPGMI